MLIVVLTKKKLLRLLSEADDRGYELGLTLGWRLGSDSGYGADGMAQEYREELETPIPQCWIKGMED